VGKLVQCKSHLQKTKNTSEPQNRFVVSTQWRTQKIFMGVSFIGIWWLFVFGMGCLWRYNLTSYSCFQTNVLAEFVYTTCIFFHTHSPYFMCYCTEYKLSALQVRISEENALNATTQQLITAKISGRVLKQGSKTHPSLCQSIYIYNFCIESTNLQAKSMRKQLISFSQVINFL